MPEILSAYKEDINYCTWIIKKSLEEEFHEEIFSFSYIKIRIELFLYDQYPKGFFGQLFLDIKKNPRSFIDVHLRDIKPFYDKYEHLSSIRNLYKNEKGENV